MKTVQFHLPLVLITCGLGLAGPAAAVDPNGWCYPADGCRGVQGEIHDNQWHTCESTCTLSDPVKIDSMEATSYQVTCKGDWGQYTERELYIKTRDFDNAEVTVDDSRSGKDAILNVSSAGYLKLEECEE